MSHLRSLRQMRGSNVGKYYDDSSEEAVQRLLERKRRRTEKLRQKAIESMQAAQRELDKLEEAERVLSLRVQRNMVRYDRRKQAEFVLNHAARTIQSEARRFLDAIDSRRLILEHRRQTSAARAIQRAWLMHQIRTEYEKQCREVYCDTVKIVQRWTRAQAQKRLYEAASKVLTRNASKFVRKKTSRRKRRKLMKKRNVAATKMQKMWRGFCTRHLRLTAKQRKQMLKTIASDAEKREIHLVVNNSSSRGSSHAELLHPSWTDDNTTPLNTKRIHRRHRGSKALSAYSAYSNKSSGRFIVSSSPKSSRNRLHHFTSSPNRLRSKRLIHHHRRLKQEQMLKSARDTMCSLFANRGLNLNCEENFLNDKVDQNLVKEALDLDIENLLSEIEKDCERKWNISDGIAIKNNQYDAEENDGKSFFLTQTNSIRHPTPVDGVWATYWRKNEEKHRRLLNHTTSDEHSTFDRKTPYISHSRKFSTKKKKTILDLPGPTPLENNDVQDDTKRKAKSKRKVKSKKQNNIQNLKQKVKRKTIQLKHNANDQKLKLNSKQMKKKVTREKLLLRQNANPQKIKLKTKPGKNNLHWNKVRKKVKTKVFPKKKQMKVVVYDMLSGNKNSK